ncbi:peptidase M6 immune inhibitor A [Actinoplanes sp. NPDC051851]|uniref:peptidase M6 immune inhibitor A n=1 Tax=Actinoplanes sp. NPDC051851 TaxID=3154753 RepID=UPI00343DC9AA
MSPAQAQSRHVAPAPRAQQGTVPAEDGRELTRTRLTLNGHPLPAARYRPLPAARKAPGRTPPVGTVRKWVGLNDITGDLYRKEYTLRSVGRHIEVWVANDIAFPANDCRKNATEITDAQVADLTHEFDTNIYPKETAAFSVPPDRSGTTGTMEDGDFTGDGDKTVTLVDNVRDDNYFDFPAKPTYIAGFFSAQLNELFDRNVMTIDAYDWAHRLGRRPANDATDDLCTSRPSRPRMYEGTFAHEWQHLLEYYVDPAESDWLNEGLSDYAQTLVGYVDVHRSVYHRGYDTHIACYLGFGNVKTTYNANPRECGGPQNSLNLWDEGDADDVLADYGISYALMVYLRDRFGPALLSTLHRDAKHQGMPALVAAMPPGVRLPEVLHDFQIMTLVDKEVGDPGGTITGVPRKRVTSPSLRSTVNLANKTCYETPGAAPNGADFVRLPRGALHTVTFKGADTLTPAPLAWKLEGGRLFDGDTPGTDAAAVHPAEVPAADPVLRFTSTYAFEDGFDYGYVAVSDDGGKTYRIVPGDRTTKGPLGPGITGKATDAELTYDLTAYAGRKVLLSFRSVTDAAVNTGGWHLGAATVGGTALDTGTLTGWRSPTEIHPVAVHGWRVSLVGLGHKRAAVVPVRDVAALRGFPKVVAIVSYDDPTGEVTQYAPYTLTVDGVVQPGGSAAASGVAAHAGGSTP